MADISALVVIEIAILIPLALLFTIKIVLLVWTSFLANLLGLGVKWRPGNNVWAVITGATDGIGLQYAKQLAAKGYSLLIVSRNEQKLNIVANDLLKENPNCKQVRTLAVDFTRTDIYNKISDELSSLEVIDVLVNNVGTVYHALEYFAKIPRSYNENYYNVNMISVTEMMALVLPKMESQKRGVIINISSQSGTHPIPLMATYSASKAYMTFLSQALSVEYASKGIIIQTVLPNQVKTKLIDNMIKLPFFAVTPEDYVSAAIKTVGIEMTTYGHWKHKILCSLQDLFATIFGERLSMWFVYYTLKNGRKNLK